MQANALVSKKTVHKRLKVFEQKLPKTGTMHWQAPAEERHYRHGSTLTFSIGSTPTFSIGSNANAKCQWEHANI